MRTLMCARGDPYKTNAMRIELCAMSVYIAHENRLSFGVGSRLMATFRGQRQELGQHFSGAAHANAA